MRFTISKATVPVWKYEIRAKGFHNIAPTVSAAVNYLIGRFGGDVKYIVVGEAAEDYEKEKAATTTKAKEEVKMQEVNLQAAKSAEPKENTAQENAAAHQTKSSKKVQFYIRTHDGLQVMTGTKEKGFYIDKRDSKWFATCPLTGMSLATAKTKKDLLEKISKGRELLAMYQDIIDSPEGIKRINYFDKLCREYGVSNVEE